MTKEELLAIYPDGCRVENNGQPCVLGTVRHGIMNYLYFNIDYPRISSHDYRGIIWEIQVEWDGGAPNSAYIGDKRRDVIPHLTAERNSNDCEANCICAEPALIETGFTSVWIVCKKCGKERK